MPKLSPPWYTLWNEVKASIGYDTSITVNPLDTSTNPYILSIDVPDSNKALALMSIMAAQHQFGNITVNVVIKHGNDVVSPMAPQSPQVLVEVIEKALGDNPLFVEAVARPLYPGSHNEVVYVVFKKDVIQFFNDDLSDYYNNYNNVAGFVFKDVLYEAPGGITLFCSTGERSS